jgi:hypothetical protein
VLDELLKRVEKLETEMAELKATVERGYILDLSGLGVDALPDPERYAIHDRPVIWATEQWKPGKEKPA